MKETIDCRIIQDLLPLYVDGLTSNYSNQIVEAHLKECPDCAQMLKYMQEPDDIVAPQKKEVDFMRKIRSHLFKWKALASTILIFLLLFAILGYILYGRMTPKIFSEVFGVNSRDIYSCQIMDWSFESAGKRLTVEAFDLMSMMKIADYYYEGVKDKYMYGNLYEIRIYDDEGIPRAHFWISDENYVYTENSTYSIRNNTEIIEYLDDLF